MKTLTVILTSLFLLTSVFADLNVVNYAGATGTGKTVTRGCTYVLFDLVGFSGSIQNVTYSNITKVLPVQATNVEGQRLGAIPYVVTSGTLNIMEVR